MRDVLTRSKNGLKSLTRNVTESMPTTHITSTSATARSKWLPYQTIMTVSKNTTPTAATRPLEIQRENATKWFADFARFPWALYSIGGLALLNVVHSVTNYAECPA